MGGLSGYETSQSDQTTAEAEWDYSDKESVIENASVASYMLYNNQGRIECKSKESMEELIAIIASS